MRILHHYYLSPSSRLIRLFLSEKKLTFLPKLELYWKREKELLRLNPSGEVPIIIDNDNIILSGSRVIVEYYEEVEQEVLLIPGLPKEKAEVRRLFDWFEFKFNKEVSNPLIDNKIIKSFLRNSQPSSDIIRNSLTNLKIHLSYLEWITEKRKWLAGNNISVADLSAAAHLSVIDYMGYIDWTDFEETKTWYAKVKSRPSFRQLLTDYVEGFKPPEHYSNLDF